MRMLFPRIAGIVALTTTVHALPAVEAAAPIPQVDLGYAIYQASAINTTSGIVSFNNIRYAASPVGSLRWVPPAPPPDERKSGPINASSHTRICPQAQPAWNRIAIPGLGSDSQYTVPLGASPLPQSEDCLLLDVQAPLKAFDRRAKKTPGPVIVFLHGGGFVAGNKAVYDGNGLLTRGGGEGVYVDVQYRTDGVPLQLGAFGWLTDPSKKSKITPNLGLLDQRQALKWIQDNIGLFGGDPKRVTVVGESAGGGSVLYHSTAYGGSKPKENKLFQRGIPQSPYIVNITKTQQTKSLRTFFDALKVNSIEQAKSKSSDELIAANVAVTVPSRYGTYTWGPTIDGDLIPELPGKLQLEGRYNRDIQMMPGHNSNEGRLFTNQSADSPADYESYLRDTYPGITQAKVNYISRILYPAKYDGSSPYRTPQERLGLTVAESLFNCHCYGTDRTYGASAYDYIFAVPPGLHFQDTKYTFYNGPFPNVIESLAKDIQTYFTSFAASGNPNQGNKLPEWPAFRKGEKGIVFTDKGIINGNKLDAAAEKRCQFWLSGDVFGPQ
ncbi:MAG: hypothetical protein M1837_003764 [Sclerophora amabilis]|nr:MAG: hypothetical protein M1837_003764 [Sclerophora amabilis]